jgi:enoyl-CoA hydratase/carnithine racemase
VGGSLILAHAPGRLGEYLGTTGARMNAGDAIFAGFADYFIPVTHWEKLKILLVETGDWTVIDVATQSAPTSALAALQPEINAHFGGERMGDIIRSLRHETTEFTDNALKMLEKNAPLSIACAVEMIHRLREKENIRTALELEYRFTYRAVEHSDFIEGIRAAIIDKDRSPNWQHGLDDMIMGHVVKMLSPLGDEKLTFTKD